MFYNNVQYFLCYDCISSPLHLSCIQKHLGELYHCSKAEVCLPANNTGSVSVVLNKCIYIILPSARAPSQVWHTGS